MSDDLIANSSQEQYTVGADPQVESVIMLIEKYNTEAGQYTSHSRQIRISYL